MVLPKEDVIDPKLSAFAKGSAGSEFLLDVYLNTNGGQALVQGGSFGKQTINSKAISEEDQAFVIHIFNKLETLINLDIRPAATENNSEIRLYYDTEINAGSSKSGTILGLTIPISSSSTNYSELFINYTALNTFNDLRKYTIVHELGHALGLEHPFENGDGDYYISTDPYQSATPDETVMSYRINNSAKLPSFYTSTDIAALTAIWGTRDPNKPINLNFYSQSSALDICDCVLPQSSSNQTQSLTPSANQYGLSISSISWEGSIKVNLFAKASDQGETVYAKQIDFNSPDTHGSVIQGGKGSDVLMSKAGWDILDGGAGNDLIHGGNGRDIITGGSGSDELWGDFGWNTYKSEKDGYADLVAIKSDQWLENWMYGKAGNNPNSEKCDIIEGLDSTDQIRIVGAATSDLTFSASASAHGISGIGIYAKGALEALYTGGDLSVAQIQSMTTGDASAAAMGNNINSYGWTSHPGTFVAS